MLRERTRAGGLVAMCAIAAAAALALLSPRHPAAATAPSALDLVDRALTSAAGPEDEGAYNLIDPIGPGGARSTDAIDEVLGPTFVAGKYAPWNYRDPFATPAAPGPAFPARPYSRDPHGGGL